MEWVVGTSIVFLGVVWLGVVAVGPPYVPTLKRDLATLLLELKLNSKHHLVDLGAGDGRVLLAAARTGASVSGVEINPFLFFIARFRLRRYRGDVRLGNMWNYHLPADTTHVFVFPAEAYMNKLERYIRSQADGRRLTVVCYGFGFSGQTVQKTIGAFNIYEF